MPDLPNSDPPPPPSAAGADEVDLTVVTMRFVAADRAALEAVLGKYVVMSRGHPGCRNIDLLVSMTDPRRLTIITKWDSPNAQRAHFDSSEMVEMARSCQGLVAEAPEIDLHAGISAHDLA